MFPGDGAVSGGWETGNYAAAFKFSLTYPLHRCAESVIATRAWLTFRMLRTPARLMSERSLCRPLFLRVRRLTVLVELRLDGFLILFAVRSMGPEPFALKTTPGHALQLASTGMSPSHLVTRIVGFFICAWPFSTVRPIPSQCSVPFRDARTKARASVQPSDRYSQ